jgi:hypothetical protein
LEKSATLTPYEAVFDPDIAAYDGGRVPARCAKVSNILFRENLLLPLGMSHYLPEKIYKPVIEYPPIIQDFDFNIESSRSVRYREFSSDLEGCVLELVPQPSYTISTYSRNTFKQEEKPLQTIFVEVPKILRFQKTFTYDSVASYKIDFETHEDRPSKVFIYIERVETSDSVFDERNPCVKGVDLNVMGQPVQSITDLDEFQSYDATRRNAAVRCDLLNLRRRTGGVLLSLDDLCDWIDFDFLQLNRDTFKGSFVISELGQVRQLDTTIDDPATVNERNILNTQDRKVTILFIYEDWCFKGEAGTMRHYKKVDLESASLIKNYM